MFVYFLSTATLLFVHVLSLPSRSDPTSADMKDYCQSEYFNVTCPRNDVILMEHAQYGRMRAGRCVSGSYGVVGCAVDVLGYFDRKCSGRKQCTVYIGDPTLHKLEPCSKDFTTYLEAKYTCLTVSSGTLSACQKDGFALIVAGQDSKSGFLASASTTDHGGIGSTACPWRLKVDEGQTIRLSLLSFGGKRAVESDDVSAVAPPEVCYEIGEIKDGGRRTTLSMCGGNSRESVVYASTGNDVIVQLLSAEVLRGLAPFVLKYDFQGCRKLVSPAGGWVSVDGNTATIRCNGSRETWYLTCTGTRWMGQAGNCSNKAIASRTEGVVALLDSSDSFPYGILIVVAIGVALGVLIGRILLSVVAYYMRRRSTVRRYVTDDVIKQAATDDELDAYNDSTTTTTNHLMVSNYNMLPPASLHGHQTPHAAMLVDSAYLQSRHYYPHSQWNDVTTITSSTDDDVTGAYTTGCHLQQQQQQQQQTGRTLTSAADRDVEEGVTRIVGHGVVCPAHLYESPRFQ